jgi:hypothetical protein
MNHSFNIEIAKEYGVEAAIIIENLNFWIEKNKANGKHFYDGKYWTYNSAKAFSELFPYWSAKQINRILNKLEQAGVIESQNYNQSSYDRTKWYSVTDLPKRENAFPESGKWSGQNREMDLPKLENGIPEIGKSYTDINTDIKPSINTDILLTDFQTFWKRYPKKVGKDKALEVWKKKKPSIDDVMFALSWQTESKQWQSESGKYIPNPATYLNQGRWQDEAPAIEEPF